MRFGVVASLLIFAFGAPAPAADAIPAPSIIILDMQRILEQSTARHSILEQVESRWAAVREEITREENALREERQALAQDQSMTTTEDFSRRQQDFQERVRALGGRYETLRRQVTDAQTRAMQSLYDVLDGLVQDVMVERGANLVLPRSEVLASDSSLDLTALVLERLNARLPTVEVPHLEGRP